MTIYACVFIYNSSDMYVCVISELVVYFTWLPMLYLSYILCNVYAILYYTIGGLKREYQDMSEELVLMRCLRDSNLPKFVYEDVPLFIGLIGM